MTAPAGLIAAGNIDLGHRPVVKNKDGSISTVRSMSFEEDGREILIPTVSEDGRILSDDEAVKLYHRTGKHLGQFRSATEATVYAQQLHEQQAQEYGVAVSDDPPKGRHGFAGPTEKEFDPESVTDWINVLHNATAVPQDSPDYSDARAVAAQAWARIGHLNRKANQTGQAAVEKGPTSIVASAIAPALHGASLGLGEPIAGVIDAASGGSFREGAMRYREGLDRLEASHPDVAAASEVFGMFAPALVPARAVIGGVQAGRPLAARAIAARVAAGAGSGAVIGGVSGFSEGGDDPGSLRQRLEAARSGAGTGAVLGTVLSGLGLKAARGKVEGDAKLSTRGAQQRTVATNERSALLREQLLQRRLDRGDVAPTTDLPIRQVTTPDAPIRPVNPDIVAAVRDYEAGRISGTDLRVAMDVARGRPVPDVVGRIQPEASGPSIWDLNDPNVMAPNLAARQFGAPEKPYAELYPNAAAEAPPQGRPNALADDQPIRKARKTKAPKIGETRFGAKVVEPGPYQRAAPASRMETPSQNTDWAEKLAVDPELLGPHLALLRSLGQEPNERMVREIVKQMQLRTITPEDQ